MNPVRKTLLTGGPGAGKTRSRQWLIPFLKAHGWHPVFLPETATDLITHGISAETVGNEAYQILQLEEQLRKEEAALAHARSHPIPGCKGTVILCDRGLLDGEAWSDPAWFRHMVRQEGLDLDRLKAGYDAVFHLESAGCRGEIAYDRSNNAARIASAGEACELDHRIRAIYEDHPAWSFVPWQPDLQAKSENLARQILAFLDQDPELTPEKQKQTEDQDA